jgi:hypothetical protein
VDKEMKKYLKLKLYLASFDKKWRPHFTLCVEDKIIKWN